MSQPSKDSELYRMLGVVCLRTGKYISSQMSTKKPLNDLLEGTVNPNPDSSGKKVVTD